MNKKISTILAISIIIFLAIILSGGVFVYQYWLMPELPEPTLFPLPLSGPISYDDTKSFLGPESQWDYASFELRDIQGLFGGRDIFISGFGKTIVYLIKPKGVGENLRLLVEKYEFSLSKSEVDELIEKFIENNFIKITPKRTGTGLPDEARPQIVLTNAKGEKYEIANGYSEENQEFDEIYNEFLLIEKKTENLTPTETEEITDLYNQ